MRFARMAIDLLVSVCPYLAHAIFIVSHHIVNCKATTRTLVNTTVCPIKRRSGSEKESLCTKPNEAYTA